MENDPQPPLSDGDARTLEPLYLFGAILAECDWKKEISLTSVKLSPGLLSTLLLTAFVLTVDGCSSLGAWPVHKDGTDIFRST